ncbi:MAG: hypothetical protein OXI81_07365, partial [Paracoccaceae bacterium]|nr:hypothetical protein [Paracoccaceae bacterium]
DGVYADKVFPLLMRLDRLAVLRAAFPGNREAAPSLQTCKSGVRRVKDPVAMFLSTTPSSIDNRWMGETGDNR